LYSLTINDNGKGFVEQKKKGFGLQLISILTNQLKGSLITKSTMNRGVCHKITIPKNKIS
jgi:two-component sensor histidine kinase